VKIVQAKYPVEINEKIYDDGPQQAEHGYPSDIDFDPNNPEDVEDYMPDESQVKKPRYSNSYGEPSTSSDRPSTSREFNFYDEE
jgi:hypothetical protein